MDDKEFRKKLSEVAEWKIPETITGTASGEAKKSRGRKSDEQLYQEAREKIFQEEFGGVNQTFPPMLQKLKNQAVVCECGKFCENGRHTEKKFYASSKVKGWKQKCVTCGKHKNPYTGAWDLTSTQASQAWANYSRGTGLTKTVEKAMTTTVNNDNTVLENSSETITFYHKNES